MRVRVVWLEFHSFFKRLFCLPQKRYIISANGFCEVRKHLIAIKRWIARRALEALFILNNRRLHCSLCAKWNQKFIYFPQRLIVFKIERRGENSVLPSANRAIKRVGKLAPDKFLRRCVCLRE